MESGLIVGETESRPSESHADSSARMTRLIRENR